MSRHRKKRLRTKQNLQASSWHLVSITQYLCVAFMMGDSILAWQKLEILPQNKCLELISSLPFNMVQIYVLRTSGLVQWVMMLQYHFNCKSTWGTSKWLMKSIQSIQTLTSQKLSVQGNTIPYHTTSSILLLFGLQMHVLLLITLHWQIFFHLCGFSESLET